MGTALTTDDLSNIWTYSDGGRLLAGYKGFTGDCLCRSVAIMTRRPYAHIYDEINRICQNERKTKGRRKQSSARTGVYKATARRYLESIGLQWTATMGIGTGCKVHLKADELPIGRLIAQVSLHWTAVIDGMIYDTHDCSRDGTRCVYGYWMEKNGLVREKT